MSEKHNPYDEKDIDAIYADDFKQLHIIMNTLQDLGLNVCEYSSQIIEREWRMRASFPIVHNRVQGVRIKRGFKGGLSVWFTNGFEDPKNLTRIEITAKLREKGIVVV